MMTRHVVRHTVALAIVSGFFVAYFLDQGNETMQGALIAAFAGAWGYYLGSSQGAAENRDVLNKLHDRG